MRQLASGNAQADGQSTNVVQPSVSPNDQKQQREPIHQKHAALKDPPLAPPLKLAAAWTSLMLPYIDIDILALYLPGVIDDIRAGVVWEFAITQT